MTATATRPHAFAGSLREGSYEERLPEGGVLVDDCPRDGVYGVGAAVVGLASAQALARAAAAPGGTA